MTTGLLRSKKLFIIVNNNLKNKKNKKIKKIILKTK